jgi:hypothetical protein
MFSPANREPPETNFLGERRMELTRKMSVVLRHGGTGGTQTVCEHPPRAGLFRNFLYAGLVGLAGCARLGGANKVQVDR